MAQGTTPEQRQSATRSRGRELRLLARIELPVRLDTKRGPVSGAAMVAVLRVIDDHAHSPERDQPLTIDAATDERGQPQPGVAQRIGKSVATAGRAIAGLNKSLKLLDVEQYTDRHGRRRNRYLILWPRIEDWTSLQEAGAVDVDAWLRSVGDGPDDEPSGDPTRHHDVSPPVTMIGATRHHDVSPPVTMTGGSSIRAHSSPPPPPDPERADAPTWEAVGEMLRSAGWNTWRDVLIDLATRPGLTAERAIAICEHFAKIRGRSKLGPGKLVCRLRNDHPDWQVHEHWGTPAVQQSLFACDLDAAIERLRAMPADELDAFAAEVLATENHRTVRGFYEQFGLDDRTACEILARELLKREAPR